MTTQNSKASVMMDRSNCACMLPVHREVECLSDRAPDKDGLAPSRSFHMLCGGTDHTIAHGVKSAFDSRTTKKKKMTLDWENRRRKLLSGRFKVLDDRRIDPISTSILNDLAVRTN
jgi:hypothetical protein